jgi:hypothetical protein
MCLWILIFVLLAGLGFGAVPAVNAAPLPQRLGLTAHVDASSGAPRLLISGRAQRARIFWGASGPRLTPELLRIAAPAARVHLYSEQDCCIYANGPFLPVHATNDGPLTLNANGSARVTDMLIGLVAGRGPKIRVVMKRGQTRVFRIGDGARGQDT